MPRRAARGPVTRITGLLTGGLLAAALAACGGTGSAPGASQSPSLQQPREVWLDYARCVRAHGDPSFPDPQVDADGRANFPAGITAKSAGQAAAACISILGRLPAAAQGPAPVTPAQLHQLVAFARCMRQHGLPQWPDPNPDGTFSLGGTPYANADKAAQQAGMQACRPYNVSISMNGSRS